MFEALRHLRIEQVFSVGNSLALSGWAGLVAAALWSVPRRVAMAWAGIVVPMLLAAAYVVVLVLGSDALQRDSFGSIAGVRALFASDRMLVAGWLHYLAFDLFVGAWIVRDAINAGVPGWLRVLPLPLTFLFGPAGLLLHFLIRSGRAVVLRR